MTTNDDRQFLADWSLAIAMNRYHDEWRKHGSLT